MDHRVRHVPESGSDGERSLATSHNQQVGGGRGVHEFRPGCSHNGFRLN